MDTRLYASQTHSDGANFLISLARRNWVDAVASAVSIIPYIGDLAKTAKLPRYIRSVRKAIDIARFDPKWAGALRELFAKLKQVLDECSKLAADLLPDAAKKQLKELKDEIDNFLSMKGGTTGKPSGNSKKTGSQSSSTTKSGFIIRSTSQHQVLVKRSRLPLTEMQQFQSIKLIPTLEEMLQQYLS